MRETLSWLSSPAGFMPHGMCYLWQPDTLWLNVASDALIAAAYYAIPFALFHLVRERRAEIPYPGVLLMFAAFILLCGTTHLMEIWTVWHPDYRVAGVLKALTGIVSVATMLALFRVIPKAMLLRSPAQLQQEVAARTAELAAVNEELRSQVAARDLAERNLRERDQRKDEFLATLAHELRNPLAPIRHAVKILSADAASPEQQQWGREVISRQAHRMALLLDDLLDVSRITRGQLALKKGRVDLPALVASAIETVRPLIERKELLLSVTLPDSRIDIDADPLRLSQALSNLLTNAAKFTATGGRIEISARHVTPNVLITVSDSGIGFDPARAAALFEMFSQSDAAIDGAEGGLGIGLSLVKGLVQLHGGSVQGTSRGRGLGAEFTITLPDTLILPTVSLTTPQTVESDPHSMPRLRVVIADDNRDAADSLGMLLELAGHETWIAHSGREALSMVKEHRPDVAILDIGMPDLNGYEVIRLARDNPWGKEVFFVALTGWGQASDKERARVAGFDRHLTKPAAPETVADLLAEIAVVRFGGSTAPAAAT